MALRLPRMCSGVGPVALAVRNNAKNVYALVPTLFNDDNGEVMSSDIAGSKQLLEDAMRESGEDEDWHEKAFGASVTSPSDRELRYLLDAQSNPKDVLTRVAKWVNGDASKQRALQALVAGTSNVTSPEIGDAMMASANLAYTASVAQKPWRAARDQSGDRTAFDLRPAAVSELRDAETLSRCGLAFRRQWSAEADLGEFPDSAVLGAPATSQDDLTAKREMHGVIQRYMLGAQRIDDWLARARPQTAPRWRRPAGDGARRTGRRTPRTSTGGCGCAARVIRRRTLSTRTRRPRMRSGRRPKVLRCRISVDGPRRSHLPPVICSACGERGMSQHWPRSGPRRCPRTCWTW